MRRGHHPWEGREAGCCTEMVPEDLEPEERMQRWRWEWGLEELSEQSPGDKPSRETQGSEYRNGLAEGGRGEELCRGGMQSEAQRPHGRGKERQRLQSRAYGRGRGACKTPGTEGTWRCGVAEVRQGTPRPALPLPTQLRSPAWVGAGMLLQRPKCSLLFLSQQPRQLLCDPPAAEGSLYPAASERRAGCERGTRPGRGAPPGGQ